MKDTNKIQEQINKKEAEISKLKKELKDIQDDTEWLYIPELDIEVQTKIHHKDETLAVAMKDLKEGELVITYEQIQWLRNSKYRNQLNLLETWEFVYPNPDKISADNGYVARFDAGSGYAYLGCYWVASYSGSSLGVRFCRKKISKGKK